MNRRGEFGRDDLAGQKLLFDALDQPEPAAMPVKTMGAKSMWPILQALGLKVILAIDPPALEKAKQRLVQSKYPDRQHTDAVLIRLSTARLRKIGAKGGQNGRKYMSGQAVQELHSRLGKLSAAARAARRQKPAA